MSERDHQVALFDFAARFEARLPELRLLFHVPNGGKRDKVVAARMKREGVKRGVPDICLPVARGEYHGLFIELKNGNMGRVSAAQRDWIHELDAQGYATAIARDWVEAARLILVYLGTEPEGYGLGSAGVVVVRRERLAREAVL